MADDQAIEDFKRRVVLDTMFRKPADELRLPDAASGSITATPRPQTTIEAWLSGLGRVSTEAMAPIERLGSGILGKTTLDSYPAVDEINTPAAIQEAMVRDSLLSLMNTGIGPTLLGKPTLTGVSTFGGLKAKPPAGSNATAPLWRSQMEDVLSAKLPGKGEPAQIAQAIEAFSKKGEFKPEELHYSGILDWLHEKSKSVAKFQGVPDSVLGPANKLSDLRDTDAFLSHGYGGSDIPTKTAMLEQVFAAAKNNEVRDAIVRFIPVDMMNVLSGKKLSAEKLFNDKSMFLELLSSPSNSDIAGSFMNVASTVIDTAASKGTKALSGISDLGDMLQDSYTAVGTGNRYHKPSFKQVTDDSPKVTKDQVLNYLAENNVQVREVTLGSNRKLKQEDIEIVKVGDNNPYWESYDKTTGKMIVRHPGTMSREQALEEALAFGPRENDLKPKFSQWQEPGGENYRELLLTLPGPKVDRFDAFDARMRKHFNLTTEEELKLSARQRSEMRMKYVEETGDSVADMRQDFRSTHYDEPNILAHVRFNERVDADGKKVLFIEEIQSDWAQKGRKEGFTSRGPGKKFSVTDDGNNNFSVVNEYGDSIITAGTREYAENAATQYNREGLPAHLTQDRRNYGNAVPDAPFVKDTGKWSMLAMKRMVRWAAENGFDRVAWTPGAMQVKRYQDAMRAVVDKISWEDVGKGKQIWGHKGNDIPFTGRINERGIFETGPAQGKTVEEMLGKDTAQKILKDAKGELSEKEMTIGGEGMKGYYDQILPAEVNKFFGKSQWGNARVGQTQIVEGLRVAEATGNPPKRRFLVLPAKGDVVVEGFPTREAAENFIKTKEGRSVHSLDITPQMRMKATTEGMPLFATGGLAPASGQVIEDLINDTVEKNKAIDGLINDRIKGNQ